jgi:hypothetical protein
MVRNRHASSRIAPRQTSSPKQLPRIRLRVTRTPSTQSKIPMPAVINTNFGQAAVHLTAICGVMLNTSQMPKARQRTIYEPMVPSVQATICFQAHVHAIEKLLGYGPFDDHHSIDRIRDIWSSHLDTLVSKKDSSIHHL